MEEVGGYRNVVTQPYMETVVQKLKGTEQTKVERGWEAEGKRSHEI